MNTEKSKNRYNDCSSKYSAIMSMIYNVENNVERMMKSQEATFKYNECLYFKGNIEKSNECIRTSNR